MKKKLSLFLAMLMLAGNLLVIPAAAEDTSPEGSTTSDTPTESKPAETAPSESSVPTEPSEPAGSEPTQGTTSTQPSEPKPCTHVFGDWTADEVSHGHTCTLCGYAEANAHSWASEVITVDPTCGEPGGKCKVCTVCAGILVTELIEPTGKHTFDNSCDVSCNVCGAERTVEHTFSSIWKYSGKGHWHYCTICGAAGEIKDHYPGPAATEEKEQICLTCGMIMMKKKEHTHKWDTAWSSDAQSHWYTCTVCQEKDKLAVHTYDDGCDTACNDCGYERTAAHTYGPDWSRTDTAHWGVCTVCGEETSGEAHVADGTGTKCSICGYAMEPAETHTHEFDPETWGFDENSHWNTCMCGEKDNAGPHVWDDGEKVEKDRIVYRCEICAAEKQEQVEKIGFPWLLLAAGGGILVCLIGVAICIIVIRRNKEEYA